MQYVTIKFVLFLNLMKKPTPDNLIHIWQQILSQNLPHYLLKYSVSWSLTVPIPGHVS